MYGNRCVLVQTHPSYICNGGLFEPLDDSRTDDRDSITRSDDDGKYDLKSHSQVVPYLLKGWDTYLHAFMIISYQRESKHWKKLINTGCHVFMEYHIVIEENEVSVTSKYGHG